MRDRRFRRAKLSAKESALPLRRAAGAGALGILGTSRLLGHSSKTAAIPSRRIRRDERNASRRLDIPPLSTQIKRLLFLIIRSDLGTGFSYVQEVEF